MHSLIGALACFFKLIEDKIQSFMYTYIDGTISTGDKKFEKTGWITEADFLGKDR